MKACLVFGLLLSFAAPVWAQTPIIDPTVVEMTASPDHSTTLTDPVTGAPVVLVASYELRATATGGTPVTATLGKPTPDAAGKIVVSIPSLASFTKCVTYTSVVVAIGPTGQGVSAPSNPFTFSSPGGCVLRSPAAPSNVIIRKPVT